MLPEIKEDSLPSKGKRRTIKTPPYARGLQRATKKQQVDTGPLESNILEEWEG